MGLWNHPGPYTYAAAILIGRQAIVDDDVDLLAQLADQLSASASRAEAEAVYGLLNGNPTMPDGSSLFSGGNDLSSTALDADGLAAGMAALRTQTDGFDNPANNTGAHLIVAPAQEATAMRLVRDITVQPARPPLRVVSAPWINTGSWYLQADPDTAQTLGFLTIGEADSTVSIQPRRTPPQADGVGLHAYVDFDAVAMSRIGIVRATP